MTLHFINIEIWSWNQSATDFWTQTSPRCFVVSWKWWNLDVGGLQNRRLELYSVVCTQQPKSFSLGPLLLKDMAAAFCISSTYHSKFCFMFPLSLVGFLPSAVLAGLTQLWRPLTALSFIESDLSYLPNSKHAIPFVLYVWINPSSLSQGNLSFYVRNKQAGCGGEYL